MKIGVVGIGVVGGAVRHGLLKLGHQVPFHDKAKGTAIEDVLDTELVYLCVPTPKGPDGACDTSVVESVVAELAQRSYGGVIAIKSTIAPGTTERLQQRHPDCTLCHVPEFLRERAAVVDFTDHHDLCIIGTDSDRVEQLVRDSHGHYPRKFCRLRPIEAELAKYFNNVYNAMLITFANDFYEVCKTLGADYGALKAAMVHRDHIQDRYLDCNENLRGFGGMCLPKDTSEMASLADRLNLPVKLFRAILDDNGQYEVTLLEGMRGEE